MSHGFSFSNANGGITVDENTRAFVYLGKYTLAGNYVDVTCAGFPLVFMSVPFNYTVNDGTGADVWKRTGCCVRKIGQISTNTWRVWVSVASPASPTIELRVFGLLNLNYPSGVVTSGNAWGMRVWDASGRLVFDSGARMLRLAGNTYDVELRLRHEAPDFGTPAAYDTSVALPFTMAGKSIQATGRSTIRQWVTTRAEFFDGTWIYFNDTYDWGIGYWASGSTLYARKVVYSIGTDETSVPPSAVDTAVDSYTRLAVIDNSQFP